MQRNSYLELCKEAAAGVDIELLSEMQPGELVGISGSRFSFRPLGRLTIAQNWPEFIGLKLPRVRKKGVADRARWDIAFMSLLMDASPEIVSYVPKFLNLMRLETGEVVAILADDVSEGGVKEVCGEPASQKAREMIYHPFRNAGSIDEVLDHHELNRTTAFDVGGVEKLLDFTPPPVNKRFMRTLIVDGYREAVCDALPDITITVANDSRLGAALLNPPPENW